MEKGHGALPCDRMKPGAQNDDRSSLCVAQNRDEQFNPNKHLSISICSVC